MGPVRTPGSASASRLDMASLACCTNGIEIADATDDAHKHVIDISRTFMVMRVDSITKLYRKSFM